MPNSITVLQYLPYVLPLAVPALWMLRCLLSALLGRRTNGSCVLCFAVTGLGFMFWPEVARFAGVEGPLRSFNLPDDIGLRLLITGVFLLVVGLLLHGIPRLVSRLDRRRRGPVASSVWIGDGQVRMDNSWDEARDGFADAGVVDSDPGDAGA